MADEEIESVLKTQIDIILNEMHTFEEHKSDCCLKEIIEINVEKYT